MNYLLHCHLETSLLEHPTLLEEFFRRGLDPILAWLDYQESIKLNVSSSMYALEKLTPARLTRMQSLIDQGRLEFLCSPAFEPAVSMSNEHNRLTQIKLNEEFLEAKFQKKPLTLFLGIETWPELPSVLATEGFRGALLPRSEFIFDLPLMLVESGHYLLPVTYHQSMFSEARTQAATPLAFDSTGEHKTCGLILSPDSMFPEDLSPVAMRNYVLDTFKILRGDIGSQTILFSNLIDQGVPKQQQPMSTTEFLTIVEKSLNDKNYALPEHFLTRLRELEKTLALLPERIQNLPHSYANKEREASARKYFLMAQDKRLAEPDAEICFATRKYHAMSVIHSQVEADTILHPEVDPLHGWIEHSFRDPEEKALSPIVLDSQLKRLYFEPKKGGALVSFEYKPRKVDLTALCEDSQPVPSFVDALYQTDERNLSLSEVPEIERALYSPAEKEADALVTRQTLDLCGLRFSRPLDCHRKSEMRVPGKFQIIKHFTVKAGIGAYLNNATTGFSVEYWLEGEIPDDKTHCVSALSILLPSGDLKGMSARPLSSFGGASEKTFSLSKPQLFRPTEIEGGLYGIRLIDGLENFVMDLRSAKPINALILRPLTAADGSYGGTSLFFFVQAKRIFQDDKANTIFLSIR